MSAGKKHLMHLARTRQLQYHHWTDRVDGIEPGIMPLVIAMDNEVVTPIFSCEGHWERRSEPYVIFVVIQGQLRRFQRILGLMMNSNEGGRAVDFQVFHHFRPMRSATGPFEDWRLTVDMPLGRLKDAEAFAQERDERVGMIAAQMAKYFPPMRSAKEHLCET